MLAMTRGGFVVRKEDGTGCHVQERLRPGVFVRLFVWGTRGQPWPDADSLGTKRVVLHGSVGVL